ncbi:hypothetical protein, partial [Kitasatospora sp. NPDC007106]
MQLPLPKNLSLTHRPHAFFASVGTLTVAGTAILALALPQDTSTAVAAAPVAAAPAATQAAA